MFSRGCIYKLQRNNIKHIYPLVSIIIVSVGGRIGYWAVCFRFRAEGVFGKTVYVHVDVDEDGHEKPAKRIIHNRNTEQNI